MDWIKLTHEDEGPLADRPVFIPIVDICGIDVDSGITVVGTIREGHPTAYFVKEDPEDVMEIIKMAVPGTAIVGSQSAPAGKKVEITINGMQFTVERPSQSYEEIVQLAGFPLKKNPTVTFRHYDIEPYGGSLKSGESVVVSNSTIFNVADTSGA